MIVGGREGYGPFDFVGWPHQLASGDLFFFHVRQERFSPEVGIPLKMVRSHADGSDLTQVRPEELSVVEALWAQDGSLSVILGSCCGDGRQALLARTDGSPLQVLIDDGQQIRSLAWGP